MSHTWKSQDLFNHFEALKNEHIRQMYSYYLASGLALMELYNLLTNLQSSKTPVTLYVYFRKDEEGFLHIVDMQEQDGNILTTLRSNSKYRGIDYAYVRGERSRYHYPNSANHIAAQVLSLLTFPVSQSTFFGPMKRVQRTGHSTFPAESKLKSTTYGSYDRCITQNWGTVTDLKRFCPELFEAKELFSLSANGLDESRYKIHMLTGPDIKRFYASWYKDGITVNGVKYSGDPDRLGSCMTGRGKERSAQTELYGKIPQVSLALLLDKEDKSIRTRTLVYKQDNGVLVRDRIYPDRKCVGTTLTQIGLQHLGYVSCYDLKTELLKNPVDPTAIVSFTLEDKTLIPYLDNVVIKRRAKSETEFYLTLDGRINL